MAEIPHNQIFFDFVLLSLHYNENYHSVVRFGEEEGHPEKNWNCYLEKVVLAPSTEIHFLLSFQFYLPIVKEVEGAVPNQVIPVKIGEVVAEEE